jgi:hypothetical protein
VLVWPGADALARIIREVASHVGIVPSPWPSPALGRGEHNCVPLPRWERAGVRVVSGIRE